MPLLQRPFGGQLLQAQLHGRPLFYQSPGPHAPGAARRGGVPVLFPQFAQHGPLPKHGFARNRDWTLHESPDGTCVAALDIAATDHPAWPHAASLRLITRVGDIMEQVLRIENTGDTPFTFTGGLHPYWWVGDVAAVSLAGLAVSGLGLREVDEWHAVAAPVILREGGRELRLAQEGFEGWQVWSPGPEHCLGDLPPADWRRFLCVEPVIMTPRRLAPGEVFEGVLRVALVISSQ